MDEKMLHDANDPSVMSKDDMLIGDREPAPGMALCLSGGGYRAMLFHLGVLWRLNELKQLHEIKMISSVSGGSITAGVLAAHWKELDFQDGVARKFDEAVVKPLRGLAQVDVDKRSILEGIFGPGSIGQKVAAQYDRHLFHGRTLQDLDDEGTAPRFVFNATSLQTRKLFRFSKNYMGDWMIGIARNPKVRLADAVAASSAFPPFLSPFKLKANPSTFEKTPPPPIEDDQYRTTIVLTDGGVYDNLGLETAWKRYKTVLVSDAGGDTAVELNPPENWAGQAYRVLNVIDYQVRSLRKRQIISGYETKIREGTYWGIRTDITHYGLADALVCPYDVTMQLAAIATRLARMEARDQEMLIDWGYAVCDAAMRTYVLHGMDAPESTPYKHFRRATAGFAGCVAP